MSSLFEKELDQTKLHPIFSYEYIKLTQQLLNHVSELRKSTNKLVNALNESVVLDNLNLQKFSNTILHATQYLNDLQETSKELVKDPAFEDYTLGILLNATDENSDLYGGSETCRWLKHCRCTIDTIVDVFQSEDFESYSFTDNFMESDKRDSSESETELITKSVLVVLENAKLVLETLPPGFSATMTIKCRLTSFIEVNLVFASITLDLFIRCYFVESVKASLTDLKMFPDKSTSQLCRNLESNIRVTAWNFADLYAPADSMRHFLNWLRRRMLFAKAECDGCKQNLLFGRPPSFVPLNEINVFYHEECCGKCRKIIVD